jgi:acetyl-CoA C-acetyltransferase
VTVNRFCSSGLQTIALAAQRIIAGEGDIYVAGGVESISCVQNEMNQHMFKRPVARRTSPRSTGTMLQTAETVAKRYGIGASAGPYGARSQQRACAAQAAGQVQGRDRADHRDDGRRRQGTPALVTKEVTLDRDEGIREDTTYEASQDQAGVRAA